jgi:hypothetical protein
MAGCAFGSIAGVGLLVGEVVAEVEDDFEAVGVTTASSPPQAAVAKTVAVTAAVIRFRLLNP